MLTNGPDKLIVINSVPAIESKNPAKIVRSRDTICPENKLEIKIPSAIKADENKMPPII